MQQPSSRLLPFLGLCPPVAGGVKAAGEWAGENSVQASWELNLRVVWEFALEQLVTARFISTYGF